MHAHIRRKPNIGRLNLVALICIACGAVCAQSEDSAAVDKADPAATERANAAREARIKLQNPKSIVPLDGSDAVAGEPGTIEAGGTVAATDVALPPAVRSRVRAETARRSGSSDASITSALAINWPDGSLGCPRAGVRYPQFPVSGYRVVVKSAGKSYDYRVASAAGAQATGTAIQVRLCEAAPGIRAVEKAAPPLKDGQ